MLIQLTIKDIITYTIDIENKENALLTELTSDTFIDNAGNSLTLNQGAIYLFNSWFIPRNFNYW